MTHTDGEPRNHVGDAMVQETRQTHRGDLSRIWKRRWGQTGGALQRDSTELNDQKQRVKGFNNDARRAWEQWGVWERSRRPNI